MGASAEYKFMQQQGFPVGSEAETRRHFKSLLFQPAIVGTLLIIAILFQIHTLFLILGMALWLNTLLPRANPFERFYDALIGRKKNFPSLPPAPAPRRFMQGMAGTLMLLAAFFIWQQWKIPAYVTQVFITAAFVLLLFGKFCVGAYLYHLLKGNVAFANTTCPWSKS